MILLFCQVQFKIILCIQLNFKVYGEIKEYLQSNN